MPITPLLDGQTATAEKLRSWRVSILRARAKEIGIVQAPNAKAAEAQAIAEFKLDEEQRKRLRGAGAGLTPPLLSLAPSPAA